MMISIQALREDEQRLQQDEQRHQQEPGRFGKFPWQREPEQPTGVLKFIRYVAQS
jgi:hypothetical protein